MVDFFSIIAWVSDSGKASCLMLSWIYECISCIKSIHLLSGLCPFWTFPP